MPPPGLLLWQWWAGLALLLALGAAFAGQYRPRSWTRFRGAAREASIVAGLYALWQFTGAVAGPHTARAVQRGFAIWHAERLLHLPGELWVQRMLLPHPIVVEAANVYYAAAHWLSVYVFLIWLFIRHRDRYAWGRNCLAVFTGVSLFLHFFAVAPPRLLPGTGFVDTGLRYGQSVYGSATAGIAPSYSTMPSDHVGWAVLIGAVVIAAGSSRWRWLVLVHVALTVFAVTVTANHFWLDGVAAAALVPLSLWTVRLAEQPVRSLTTRLLRPPAPAAVESATAVEAALLTGRAGTASGPG